MSSSKKNICSSSNNYDCMRQRNSKTKKINEFDRYDKCNKLCDDFDIVTDSRDADNENLKTISIMDDYLRQLFYLFTTLYKASDAMITDLYALLNALNFKTVDTQFIDEYNKILLFMYENTKNLLSSTITLSNGGNLALINEPNDETKTYAHKITLILIQQNNNYITHFLGNITNISISLINDQITFQRGSTKYVFVTFDNSVVMTNDDFRAHLDNYVLMVKEMMGSYYNDISFIKNTYKTFLKIVKDLFNESIKLSACKKKCNDLSKWESTLLQLKCSLYTIDNYLTHFNCAKI